MIVMRFILVLSLFLTIFNGSTWAGDYGRNGADTPKELDGIAWFLGPRPIRYCLEVSPDFAVEAPQAGIMVEQAFQTWRTYMRRKRINEQSAYPQSVPEATLTPPSAWIVGNTIRMAKCDGTEDLIFELGVINEPIRKYLTQFNAPAAFAELESYDAVSGWGKGMIWVAPPNSITATRPDWHSDFHLAGILLHEIGHTLGNGHIAGTIMDADIALNVLQDTDAQRQKFVLSQIDSFNELSYCRFCTFDYKDAIERTPPGFYDSVFTRLTRSLPQGAVNTHLQSNLSEDSNQDMAFVLNDSIHSYRLPVRLEPVPSQFDSGEPIVFKRALTLNQIHHVFAIRPTHERFQGFLEDINGRKLPIVLDRNFTNFPSRMGILSGISQIDWIFFSGPEPLFLGDSN